MAHRVRKPSIPIGFLLLMREPCFLFCASPLDLSFPVVCTLSSPRFPPLSVPATDGNFVTGIFQTTTFFNLCPRLYRVQFMMVISHSLFSLSSSTDRCALSLFEYYFRCALSCSGFAFSSFLLSFFLANAFGYAVVSCLSSIPSPPFFFFRFYNIFLCFDGRWCVIGLAL